MYDLSEKVLAVYAECVPATLFLYSYLLISILLTINTYLFHK